MDACSYSQSALNCSFTCTVCHGVISNNSLSQYIGKCEKCTASFTCQYCIYVTSFKSNFIRHMMRHTGERPFKCGVCSKGFITKHHLNYHVKTHH